MHLRNSFKHMFFTLTSKGHRISIEIVPAIGIECMESRAHPRYTRVYLTPGISSLSKLATLEYNMSIPAKLDTLCYNHALHIRPCRKYALFFICSFEFYDTGFISSVCEWNRVRSVSPTMNFWHFCICNLDFVSFWLGIWYEPMICVIMGRRGYYQN